jgi:hypothetical protein
MVVFGVVTANGLNVRGCSVKMANFEISILGPENQRYHSNGVH